jgi:hypothetical protein
MSTSLVPTTPAADSAEPPPTPTRTLVVYLLVVLVLAGAVFAAVGVVNARLNPYIYDGNAIDTVAQGLANGLNLANYDPNVDLRKLRKAQIERMPVAPDVVIFGGSRWQEARSEIIPGGHRVYNAYVSNDQIEDMLAISNILYNAHKLPKTIVFSLRFVSLQAIPERTTFDWKGWQSDYATMAGRLGVDPASYLDRAPVQQVSGQYFFPDVFNRWQQVSAAKATPTLTTASESQHLDIIASDGSLHWSADSRAKFTRAFVNKAVDTEILTNGTTRPGIDQAAVAMMGKLIDWLRAQGVKVMLIQSPYRSDYWQRIQSYPFVKTLYSLANVARQMQAQHGAIAYNLYDSAPYPHCGLDNFVDHIHPTWQCLQDVFHALPDLVTGVKS